MFNNDNKETTTAISFDADWRYIRLTNTSPYDAEFALFSYNDHDWKTVQLPHHDDKKVHKFTSTCVSYWYRKQFDFRQKLDTYQHIYLHFESISTDNRENDNESDVKIPHVTVWLNEDKLFQGTLPEPISLTKYLKNDSKNLLAIYSQRGFRLRLHSRLLIPHRLSGQIDFDALHENTSGKGPERLLDYSASFDDSDGLIALFIHAVKQHAKNSGIDHEPGINLTTVDGKESTTEVTTAAVTPTIDGPIPRLAIVMLIVGTRGDVQPFIALAKALLACGHRVRLATHETFRTFVRENGIEFYPLAGDPADLMSFMVKNAGIVPSVSSIVAGDISKSRRLMGEILASTWKACVEDDDETDVPFVAEAIIANPPSYGHIHCAQKLQIPLHVVFTMPWSPTVQFPHPLCKVDYNREPIDRINILSYGLVEVLTWSGMRNIINDFRKTLGLAPLHTRQAVRLMIDEHVPHTYCWSPSLVPKPNDWGSHIDVSGFFFLDLATNYKPPEDLVQFLQAGKPPIYIGFGSITGHDSERLLQAVLEALNSTGDRALISGFNVDQDKLPDTVFKIGNCPHDWLFQHVVAVCHHGGAGTTAAGLRAGKPTIIVPFFGDQFFWGSMISKSGAGPVPMPGKTVTAKQFASAFEFVHDPKTQVAASKISTDFTHEHGCEMAVQSFHAQLPLKRMRSDLDSSFGACFRLKDYNLQISRPVAQVLMAAGFIEESQLSTHGSASWNTLVHGGRLETFTLGLKHAVSKIADSVHRLKRAKSTGHIDVKRPRNAQHDIKHELFSVRRPFKDCIPLYGEAKAPLNEEEEEQNDKSKSEKKAGPSVTYAAGTFVAKSADKNVRQATGAGNSSSAVGSPRKVISKSQSNKTLSRALPYEIYQVPRKPERSSNVKSHRFLTSKAKAVVESKDKNSNKSPEQRAADLSGLSLDVCKQILTDFKQKQTVRNRSHDNEKSGRQNRNTHVLHRLRSRSLAPH